MLEFIRIFKSNKYYFLFYFLVSAIGLYFFRFYVDSVDGFEYLALAKQYALSNFFETANSHWSPLLSWILAPFSFCFKNGIIPVVYYKVVQILIGFVGLYQLFKMNGNFSSSNYEASGLAKFLSVCFSITSILFFSSSALLFDTPDLLFVTIALIILNRLNKRIENIKHALFLAFFGGLLYYAKSIGFVVFLALIVYSNFTYIHKGSLKYFVSTIILFFIFCAPWITLISVKQNSFSISSASTYNYNIMNPSINSDCYAEIQHPFNKNGLQISSNKNALNQWQEPYKYNLKAWKPFDSKQNLNHYKEVVLKNSKGFISYYFGFDLGIVVILLGVIVFRFFGIQFHSALVKSYSLLFACSVLIVLYCLVLVQHRYLWLFDIALLILAFNWLKLFLIKQWKVLTIVLSFLVSGLFLKDSIKEVRIAFQSKQSGIIEQINHSILAAQLEKGNIASFKIINMDTHYFGSAYAYFLNSQYLGSLANNLPLETALTELKETKVKYLLSFEENNTINDLKKHLLVKLSLIDSLKSNIKLYKIDFVANK